MKNAKFVYPQIDLKRTGSWLRILSKHYGYSVKDLQEYLQISSNQAIYEWFNGHTLPSVNNLLALSTLFDIPMNLLLVDDVHNMIFRDNKERQEELAARRCRSYYLLLKNDVVRLEKHGA